MTPITTTSLTIAALLLAASPAVAAPPAPASMPAPVADLADSLGDLAVKANPSVAAIEARIRALQQMVRAAGAWMDPMASAEYSNMPIDSWIPGKHPMSGIQFMLRQTFYWPGKIKAREEEAESRVREARLSLAERKLQLRTLVRRAYYRLALVRQLRRVTADHVTLVGQFLDVVRVKYEAGKVAQHELLRLRVLKGKLGDDLNDFDRDAESLAAAINATLHRDLATPVPTPSQLAVSAPRADAATLARRADGERPLLLRLDAAARTYRAAARRAAREGYPDITVWAGYRVRLATGMDAGTDFVSFGVSLPIPFSYDRRWGSQRRHNEELAQATRRDRAAELDGIRGELGRVVASWKRAAQEARTYRVDLIREARLTLDATFAAYKVERADFASLYQAELQLLDFERTARLAEARAAESRVDADALVGTGADQ